MLLSACAEEPPAAATVSPAGTASEAVGAAPAPELKATTAASVEVVPPSVSGDAPPPEPPPVAASAPAASASAAAGSMSEARKAALAKELDRLEVQMLDVLDKEPHPNVLDRPRLDDVSIVAAPGSEVRVGRAGSGAASLDTPPPERPLTISGKPLKEATAADVEAALREAGCTEITKKPGAGPLVVITATKGADSFIVTFLPASADIALDTDERARLLKEAAVVEKDGLFLAVEAKGWKGAARALLDAVARRS